MPWLTRKRHCLPSPSVGRSPLIPNSGISASTIPHMTSAYAQCGLFSPDVSRDRLELPSHYSISICIHAVCNGYIPSQLRVPADVLPPNATFNPMHCDYARRLIEVLPFAPTPLVLQKDRNVLSATPSTSCRSIDHLTLLSCLVSHQAGLHFYRMLLPLR